MVNIYKGLGKLGYINLRSITYQEDRMVDETLCYKWAFDFELLPCVRLSNHYGRVSVSLRWLNWEFMWLRYKASRKRGRV